MNFKYCVCILANDMDYFDVMMRNFVSQSKDILFVICCDTRVKDNVQNIKNILTGYKMHKKNDFKIITDVQVNNFCRKSLALTESGEKYLDEYTMGMNINMQYFIMNYSFFASIKKCLFLDDDVIINGLLDDLFTQKDFMFCVNCLSSGKTDEGKPFMNFWLNFANVDFKTWKKHNINGGQRLYIFDKKINKIYANLLENFYNSEYLFDCWKCWKDTGKGKGHAFFQDQYFENSFAWAIGNQNDKLKEYARVCFSAKRPHVNLSLYVDRPILHYCCGSKDNKMNFLNTLRMAKVIK